jgi:uncharacterized cupredoxin-like copper-binding protein
MFRKRVGLFRAACLAGLGCASAFADQSHGHKPQAHKEEGHPHSGGGHAGSPAGTPGKASKVSRTIHVRMLDSMRFEPASFEVKSGETIKFIVTNAGQLQHEFGIGSAEEQKAHAEMMLADPEMKHDDGTVIVVAPGKAGTLIWRFGKAGEYESGCQVPGHYPAGMKARIAVSKR